MTEAQRVAVGRAGLRHRRLRPWLWATTALSALALARPAPAQAPLATPAGGVVVAGAASISQAPGATTIMQGSERAAINWQSFDVGSRAAVAFRQPDARAVTLNRVLAGNPSTIAGNISANGSIVLVNPDGIVFAKGAVVNTAGLVASAIGISNRNFMAGHMVFDRPGNPAASIVNRGSITVAGAGLAALVAPAVANSGVISAKLGSVVLAGARTATLDLYGDGLVSLDVEGAVQSVPAGPGGGKAEALVTNSGTIFAQGGTVLLTAKAVDGLVQNLVDAGGTISANGVSGAAAGTILVQGIGGSIRVAGTLTASGTGPGGTGGAIGLDATRAVVVAKTARIDASGPGGGGLVAVGTSLARAKGGPGTPAGLTARRVRIAAGAGIAADATQNGNGGRVTVLASGSTEDSGAIGATGGPAGGNGGFVEISGHDLGLTGSVNTGAPLGQTGTILLDPTNLTILNDASNDSDIAQSAARFNLNGVAWQVTGSDSGSDTVSPAALEALSGNVTLQATNDITFVDSLAIGTLGQAPQSLLVEAGNSIVVDSGVTVSATGNLEMDASSAAIPGRVSGGGLGVVGAIQAGGNISLSAGTGGIDFGFFFPPPAGDGNVTANAATGVITLNTTGNVEQVGGIITAGTLTGAAGFVGLGNDNAIGTLGSFTAPEAIFLNDAGNLTVAGPVNAANVGSFVSLTTAGDLTLAGEVNATAGAVILTAGGSITEPGGAIVADSFTGSSGGAALFTGVNRIGTLAVIGSTDPPVPPGFKAGGNFTLVDATPLTLTAPITVPNGDSITLVTDGLFEGSQTVMVGDGGSLTVFGALEAPGGEVALEPFTPGVPVALVGAGAQPAGTLAIDDPLLAAITAGTLSLASSASAPITISGTNQLGGLTDPNTGSLSGVATLAVAAGGLFGESAGASLNVGALTGRAGSVALDGANLIPVLGPFASSGGFSLADLEGLTVLGNVSGPSGITLLVEAGSLALGSNGTAGTLASAGVVDLVVPAGSIVVADGGVTAGTLTGTAQGLAEFGTADVVDLGAFSVTGTAGNFSLTNSAPLTISGPLSAAVLDVAAPGTLTLSGNIFTNSLALSVTSGGVFQQLGTSVITPLSGGTATVRIQLPAAGGSASFANLQGSGTDLVLGLGPSQASGTIAVGKLLVIGAGGSAGLFGSVGGVLGPAAAGVAQIQPAINVRYLFNGCVIGTAICTSLLVQAQGQQESPYLLLIGGGPSLSPKAGLPAIVLFTIPAVVGESWSSAGGFPLPNIARLDY